MLKKKRKKTTLMTIGTIGALMLKLCCDVPQV